MSEQSTQYDDSGDDPMDNMGSLLDVAQEVDTENKPKIDPAKTILASNGEVIHLNESADKIKRK